MTRARWVRWGGLALLGVLAALVASFNSRERVAIDLGPFTVYQVPLVPLLFGVFIAGMAAMFLLGLAHDLRVRRALRDAGFEEPTASAEHWPLLRPPESRAATEEGEILSGRDEPLLPDDEGPPLPGSEPPPRFPP